MEGGPRLSSPKSKKHGRDHAFFKIVDSWKWRPCDVPSIFTIVTCAKDAFGTGAFQAKPDVRIRIEGFANVTTHAPIGKDDGKANGLQRFVGPIDQVIAKADADLAEVLLQLSQLHAG